MKLLILALTVVVSSTGAFAQASSYEAELIAKAKNGEIQNCEIKQDASGQRQQLYILKIFAGSYGKNKTNKLSDQLKLALVDGICRHKGNAAKKMKIIEDAASGKSNHCKVILGASNQFTQLYINDEFSGNFELSETDDLIQVMHTSCLI